MLNRLILIITLLISVDCFATTYYMSPSGSDSYTTEQAQSDSTPWKTFSKSFSEMVAADELILLDGTYSVAAGTGCIGYDGTGSAVPPNGTSTSAMTKVTAQNIGLAVIDGTSGTGGYSVYLGTTTVEKEYIKIEGIFAKDGIYLYAASYCYIKNVGSNGAFLTGSPDHSISCDYNLFEDFWVWTYGVRALCTTYNSQYTIWRRGVIRADGDPGRGQASPAITTYGARYTLFQNVIVIDRTLDLASRYADFSSAYNPVGGTHYVLTGNEWRGCMSVNSIDYGFHLEGNSTAPGVTIDNSIVLNNTNGFVLAGFNIGTDTPTITNINIIQLDNYTHEFIILFGSTNSIARNVIIKGDTARYAAAYINDASYFDTYGTFTLGTYNSVTCSTGCLTTDPENDGSPVSLLYPVRIETGSALSGTGYNSTDYGATILKKHGTTGAFYGETGYNTLTSDDLWPWPNEDLIKSQMSVEYSDGNETRGFCTTGNQIDGSTEVTLTSYIWEYLGNQIPSDIYGDPESSSIGPGDSSTFSAGDSTVIN